MERRGKTQVEVAYANRVQLVDGDVSTDGLVFRTREPPAIGDKVRVSVYAENGSAFTVIATARRVDPHDDEWEVALAFAAALAEIDLQLVRKPRR